MIGSEIMDKQAMIAFIMEEYALVGQGTRPMLESVLQHLAGNQDVLSAESLQEWGEEELGQLHQVMSGIKLTREYVPDIVQAYENSVYLNLPSKVSFGYFEHNENVEEEQPVHHHYGKYEVPPMIHRLYELQAELGRAMDLDMGLIMQERDCRYSCTPVDFIPFARSGGDGIHYCFVTDFGTVQDLEHANIAVVSPMDFDDAIWLVAKNMNDFLRIICTDRTVLYNNPNTSRKIFEKTEEQVAEALADKQSPSIQRLKQFFGLNEIADMAEYIRSVQDDREQAICIQTLDTIGIVPLSGQKMSTAAQPLSIDWNDERGMDALLKDASPETKLAFIRDAQHQNYIVNEMNERRIQKSCKKLLLELKLIHELRNLIEIID